MVKKEKYQAAFIIPRGSKKILEEDGWDFMGGDPLPEDIEEFLVSELGVRATEDYLDMRDYAGEGIKASVFFGERKKIENVYFQVLGYTAMEMLERMFKASKIEKYAELFIPRRGAAR